MSLAQNADVLEVGCDYVSATTPATSFKVGIADFGRFIIEEETRKGCKRRDSRAGGYQTMFAGCSSVGVRHDGTLVRIWGEAAKEYWNQLVDLSQNITRFDAQVTIRYEQNPSQIMQRIWKQNPGWTSGSGRRSKVKERSGPTGMESMEIGSRQSDCFMRIYDKFLQSELPWYEKAVRWELELKGNLALQYSRALTVDPKPDATMYGTVRSFAARRLNMSEMFADCAGATESGCELRRSPRASPDCIRSLRFLHLQVAPMISRLVAAGYRDDVLAALGLQHSGVGTSLDFEACKMNAPGLERF